MVVVSGFFSPFLERSGIAGAQGFQTDSGASAEILCERDDTGSGKTNDGFVLPSRNQKSNTR